MEAGWIPGTDRILRVAWIPETAERRFLLTRTMLTESGGLILQDRPFPAAPYKQVFICRRCRKGVFPSRTTRETSKPKASDSTKQRLPFQGPIPPIRGKCPEGTKGVGMLAAEG